MKTNQILLSVIAIIMLSFTSCKKYPDGPVFSIHSKTDRVANNWKVGEALENGNDITENYEKWELDLTKGGNASLSAKYVILGIPFEYVATGTWIFVSNKEEISFDFDRDEADGVYEILRLKTDEMWLSKVGDELEFHYITR